MNIPSVYVLVINWNGMEHLQVCFESLQKTTYENAFFVLVDNDSNDDSVKYVEENFRTDKRVSVLKAPENLGWSKGNNFGIEWALDQGADYVLLWNNDTWTHKDAIANLVESAEKDGEIGALSPKLLMFETPNILNSLGIELSTIGSSWDLGIGRRDSDQWKGPREILGVCGAAMFLRSSTLKITGLLPDDYEIYLDDLDLCLRIWNAGFSIQSCPSAVVYHKFSATTGEGEWARKKYFLNTRNRLKIIQRFFPLHSFPNVAFRFVLGEARAIGRSAATGEFWKISAHLRSWGGGIIDIPKSIGLRKKYKSLGLVPYRFWRFVRKDKMFFEGTVFPKSGFYPKNDLGENPICDVAWWDHDGGEMCLSIINPMPEKGRMKVEVLHQANLILDEEIETEIVKNFTLEYGSMTVISKTLYLKEDTGLLFDIGAYIKVTPLRDPHEQTETI